MYMLNKNTGQIEIVDETKADLRVYVPVSNDKIAAVEAIKPEYRKVDEQNKIVEMTADEKIAIDAQILADAILAMHKKWDDTTRDYILNRYALERQTSFILMMTLAMNQGLTNRAAYIQKAIDWVNSVLSYHFEISDQITAARTLADVAAITWDLSTFDATDPDIWIQTAMEIPD